MWVQFLQEAQEVTKSCVPFSDRVTFLGSMETRFLSFFPSEGLESLYLHKLRKSILFSLLRESQRKLVVEGRTNLTIETVRNIKTDLATMSRKDVCNKYGITKSID